MSKTISLEQYKATACKDAAKTEYKDGSKEKDIQKVEIPAAVKFSVPCSSTSSPRQSKTSGVTQRSARSSAAHSARGTYVKSKSGFSKYGQHSSTSPSSSVSKHTASVPGSSVTKKVVDSELSAPKVSPKSDGPIDNSCRRSAVDDADSISQLFAGSYISVL